MQIYIFLYLAGNGLINGIISLFMENGFLTWEATYAIALALRAAHPDTDLEQVSLGMIFQWTKELPQFSDEPSLANDEILTAIYQEWFEEINSNE